MAKVFQKGKNWGIDYLVDGRRKREMVGNNKLFAEKVLRKRLTLLAENKHLDIKRIKRIKFDKFGEEYLERHCKRNLRGWEKSSRSNVRHLTKYFGDKFLHEIKSKDIEKFIDWRLKHINARSKKAITNNTVNKDLGCLRTMFNKSLQWEYLDDKSPMQGIKLLPIKNSRTRFLEKEEIKRLLSNCEGHLKDIVEFALNTGMRKGEIFNLKWRDVDLKRGLMHLLQTKNGDKREVPINAVVKDILYRVRKVEASPYVFSSYDGKPFNDIKRSYNTALKKSNIEDFRFHDLRHTFASHLIMAGVDLLTVKELLGHKRIEMTLRYSHLNCDHKLRAVDALCKQININSIEINFENELSTLVHYD